MISGLAETVADARSWLVETALPLWLKVGLDPLRGGFHERLDFGGRPIDALPRRLMVQARQIYVFAHASLLGWCDARDTVSAAFSSMIAGYFQPDGRPGWVFSVSPDSAVGDARRDLYAHGFVLLACAWMFRLTGDALAIRIADRTLEVLDQEFRAKAGGYRDSMDGDDRSLRQNPHMHLFEALLALYEATGAARYLDRADAIHALLRRFFLPGPDILAEYFNAAWQPVATAGQGSTSVLWEPGHHCEWVWLLQRYADARGQACDPIAAALYQRAYRDGIAADALIADEMTVDGRVAKPTRRAWPLTEAIKANVVRHQAGDSSAADRAGAALTTLSREFLRPDGLWIDQLDWDGRALVDYVPASTLYHIFLAIAEVDAVFGAGGG